MKKIAFCFLVITCFLVSAQEKNSASCWTLIHNGEDIYNGQYLFGQFPGHYDPETLDLEDTGDGFLTCGYYNNITFDSRDGADYTNLVDKGGSYLTKHDYDGNLQWIVYTEKDQFQDRDVIYSTVQDQDGNIYINGYSLGGTFHDTAASAINLEGSNGSLYGFIMKLNSDGELIWRTTVDNVFPKRLDVDANNNLIVTGDVQQNDGIEYEYALDGIVTDSLSNFKSTAIEDINQFVLKIDTNGQLLWYTGINSSGPNGYFLMDVGSDANNNIYVTGYASNTVDIYSAGQTSNQAIINWPGISGKTFLIKFDENGQVVWTVKSLLASESYTGGVLPYSITVDEQGNTYITGTNDNRSFQGDEQIFENTDGSTTSEQVGTYFVAKVDTNGICQWIKGAYSSYYGIGHKIIQSNDEIIVAGYIRENSNSQITTEVEFLSSDGNNRTVSINRDDVFIAVYDTDGNIRRLFGNGVNDGIFFFTQRISGLIKDANDNYYMSRNIGFGTGGPPQSYSYFAHQINSVDTERIDGTITKFIEDCGTPLGSVISQNITNISVCDNTSVGTDDDGLVLFDLTSRESEMILTDEPLGNFQITYYTDENLTNQIVNPQQYQNTAPVETIYVRAEHTTDPNKSGSTSFGIEVIALPVINSPVSLAQCDDDVDGFSVFNLTEVNDELSLSQEIQAITFHESLSEAESGTNPITNTIAYTNETVSTDIVWARIENENTCFRTAEVNLIVSTTQIPDAYTRQFYQCDDGSNTTDGVATFDFSTVNSEIQSIFPPGQQLIISYYTNQIDALSEINPIADISNYQNTDSPNSQEIYVRVDSALDNDCLGLGHHITLTVEANPIANSVVIPEQCDADRDGLFAFDTSTIESTLLAGQTGMTVTYTDEYGNALPSPLPNPFTTASQTITAYVENANSQDPDGTCSDQTTIEFRVLTVPVANPVDLLEQCDDDVDGMTYFDTTSIQSTVMGSQTGMNVEYFDENGNALPSPLPNPFFSQSQTITARVVNPSFSGCYNDTSIEFRVREKPNFELPETDVICVNGSSQLDVSISNPNGTYSYEWTNESGTLISSEQTATIQQGGTYSVIAISPDGCTSEIKQISIAESEIANLDDTRILTVDDSINNRIMIDTADLGIGDYEFSLLDENLVTLVNFQDTPTFENLDGGIYTVLIRDKNGCGIGSKEVSLLTFPKFFTPNNDGINDTWNIKGYSSNVFRSGKVDLFNRFGKPIGSFALDGTNDGWNGIYGSRLLPSDGYWFHAQIVLMDGTIRTRKGYFSMLRN